MFALPLAQQFAIADTCVSSGNFKACAAWSSGSPVHGTHFQVTFNGSDPPDVELLVGRDDWTVYVQNSGGTAPASMGQLTASASANFTVVLAGPGSTPGAVNVGAIDLQPSGDHRSSLGAGSRISGVLAGDLILQATSGGAGGVLTSLVIDGGIDILGVVDVQVLGSLVINDDHSGTILADVLTDNLTVYGITQDGFIRIGDLEEGRRFRLLMRRMFPLSFMANCNC
ncbi:MAG: hypothetical protein IPM64_02395 [Phycisphaerales bacterium]|nr:hypothetical protein [Phycisphaerales bacterium]